MIPTPKSMTKQELQAWIDQADIHSCKPFVCAKSKPVVFMHYKEFLRLKEASTSYEQFAPIPKTPCPIERDREEYMKAKQFLKGLNGIPLYAINKRIHFIVDYNRDPYC